MTLRQYATLVQELRTAQKATGTGYKTPEATTAATSLEAAVDAATVKALKPWPFNVTEAVDA